MVTRGFFGKKEKNDRVPPGQYLENRFPVLSAEPTPKISLSDWNLSIIYEDEVLCKINWDNLKSLTSKEITKDIHCVTRWTKFDMKWKGVKISTLFNELSIKAPTNWTMIGSFTGYTTNLPLKDLLMDNTIISYLYEDKEITPEHGGPIRLIVPHLYFWKSAKWVDKITFIDNDKPGFWENYGYHMYGDPWKEQRYSGQ
ncbi:MAG: molybdopterin-dependent oxidoreductase [Chloroflexota bacterium]|nr:molybdopterin-dependent oxidoreductase [Chloroflexota bacterium]